jgi:cytochrome o ubiquinol oxidase subunit 3
MELGEFAKLIGEGHGPSASAFLSSYFTLVGTHGLHIAIGLMWIIALSIWILRRGINNMLHKRLVLFSLFWHFLDIIWIFIFTIVYLFGALAI